MLAQIIVFTLAIWATGTSVALGVDASKENADEYAQIGSILAAIQAVGLIYVFLTLL